MSLLELLQVISSRGNLEVFARSLHLPTEIGVEACRRGSFCHTRLSVWMCFVSLLHISSASASSAQLVMSGMQDTLTGLG